MFAEFTWGTQSIFAESHFYMIFWTFVDLNGLVFSNRFGPSEWVFCNVWLKISLLFGMLISIYYLFGCYSPNTNAQQFINKSKIIICRIACRVHIVERAWVGLGVCGVCVCECVFVMMLWFPLKTFFLRFEFITISTFHSPSICNSNEWKINRRFVESIFMIEITMSPLLFATVFSIESIVRRLCFVFHSAMRIREREKNLVHSSDSAMCECAKWLNKDVCCSFAYDKLRIIQFSLKRFSQQTQRSLQCCGICF